jgi:hypothetical protein
VPVVREQGGQSIVDAFEHVLSVDFAPLGRAGMRSASVLYAGETSGTDEMRRLMAARFKSGFSKREDRRDMDAQGEMVAIGRLVNTSPEQARAAVGD